MKKQTKQTYDKLYLSILEIGQSRVNGGLSYNDLCTELEKEGYDFENDCIELAVQNWFINSFIHYKDDCVVEIKDIKDLEEHLDCNFILKGEACLALLGYKTSYSNIIYTRVAIGVAVLAIIISSICALLPASN